MTASNQKRGRSTPPTAPAANPTSCRVSRPLIDKFGGRHSEAALENWSPAAIKAMGLHRTDDEVAADLAASDGSGRRAIRAGDSGAVGAGSEGGSA